MLSPHDLLLRLAGRMDLRAVPAVHFPVFVLGRDRRAVFDSVFYATRAVAERMDPRPVHTPYPLPEDYPSDWPHRDPIEELARQVTSMLPPGAWPAARPAAEGGLRAQVATLHPQILRRLAEERTVVWDLLQDRSRLLNPTDPDRTTRGKLIRGPWPG